MSVQIKRAFGRFIIFGLMGLLFEVLLGAVLALKAGNWNMRGGSSPWMMFDYGLLGLLLMPVARPMIRRNIPLPLRAVVYMIAIFAVEFVSGWIFELCGLRIWGYEHLRWNLYGYIAPQYIPVWYALGLAAEFLYRRVDMASLALVRGVTPEQLEAWSAPASPTETDPANGRTSR